MVNFHNKAVLGLAILVMLSTSPMSVSYTFAESSDEFEQKIVQSPKIGTNTQAIITEKVVDGKLEVKRFALPENISKEDMNRMISFEGETSGWAYVSQKAYQSGIILYDGKLFKVGKNMMEISDEKTLGLHGFTETSKNEEFSFRVIFSGKVIEAGSETFAVIFTNPSIRDPNTDLANLVQTTENITSYSDTNFKSFRNSVG